MTNQQQAELLAACAEYFTEALEYNEILFTTAKWAFWLAIGLAVANALVDLYIKWNSRPKKPQKNDDTNERLAGTTSEIIKAATGLIDSLAKAPVWFFLFVSGMALIWISTVDVPEICVQPMTGLEQPAAPETPASQPEV